MNKKDIFEGKTQKAILDIIGKKVKLGSIDMYGMLGRDNHPKKTDGGKVVRIVGFDILTKGHGDFISDIRHLNLSEKIFRTDLDYVSLLAKTQDGRLIQVINYEIDKIVPG